MTRLTLSLAAAVLLASCSVTSHPTNQRPQSGCQGHGGVAKFEVHDGVGYYACRDGAVGRL